MQQLISAANRNIRLKIIGSVSLQRVRPTNRTRVLRGVMCSKILCTFWTPNARQQLRRQHINGMNCRRPCHRSARRPQWHQRRMNVRHQHVRATRMLTVFVMMSPTRMISRNRRRPRSTWSSTQRRRRRRRQRRVITPSLHLSTCMLRLLSIEARSSTRNPR